MGIADYHNIEVALENLGMTGINDEEGMTRIFRDAPPSHFSFKVQSFSLLSKAMDKYDSCDFEAGGYKWKLSLYPKGNNVDGHISLYLRMAETSSLPLGWEVNVAFRFFLFDQIRDKYLAIGDIGGRVKRFHGVKTEQGFSQLLPLTTFSDPANGYLVDDTCIFGVEVFVCKSTGKGECLSMMKDPSTSYHSWKIERFSSITAECYISRAFSTGDHPWIIKLYPRGFSAANDISISIYVALAYSLSLSPGQKVYAEYTIRVRDQINGNHIERKKNHWFSHPGLGNGFDHFMELAIFEDPSNGFLVKDACIIEAEVAVLGVADKLP